MKKLMALVLTLALTASLAACGTSSRRARAGALFLLPGLIDFTIFYIWPFFISLG